MSFDVSLITDYVREEEGLIRKLQFSPELTATQATIIPKRKGTTRLHYFETDVVFQDGAGCTRTASGTTSFSEKEMTVSQLSVSEDLCLDDLRGKWSELYLREGTMKGKQELNAEFAEKYFAEKNVKWVQATEVADWQGDTGSGSANLQQYDGWIKFIDAATGPLSAVDGNTGGVTVATGVNAANILDILEGMYNSTTEEMDDRNDLVMYVPRTWYKLYISALKSANLFHYNGDDGQPRFYGTDMPIRPTYGLRGLDRAFITYPKNFVVGMDEEGEEDFDYRVDPVTNKKILVDANWTRGCQVYFTEQVVEFTLV